MTRLLAIRLSALGDVIHTMPAVMSLREAFDVSWVVEAPYAEMVEIVAGVKAIPVRLKRWSLREIRTARQSIRGFDVTVDFQGLLKSAVLASASGARDRYGFAKEAVRERPAAIFYNHRVTIDRSRHVVDWNQQLAGSVPGRRQPASGNWSEYARDSNQRLVGLTNRIVVLPGAGRPGKQWPVARFRELVARYRERALIVCGPGERTLADAIGGTVAPETNLRELAFILRSAAVVVGGDTGPLHLADALGTRVVGLYGPTDPRRNGPYRQIDRTIDHFHGSKTMQTITIDEVTAKIDEVLSE